MMHAYLSVEVLRDGHAVASAPSGLPEPSSASAVLDKAESMARALLGREPAAGEVIRFGVVPDDDLVNVDVAFDALIEAAESGADYALADAAIALRTAWSRGRSLDAARALLRASGASR